MSGSKKSGRPGQGGINRGRGDAPISFGDESDAQGVKFQEVVLPPGTLADPEHRVLKLTSKAPQVDPGAAAGRRGGRVQGPAAGGATWNRRLRPRHRGVVKKYFGGRSTRKKSVNRDDR